MASDYGILPIIAAALTAVPALIGTGVKIASDISAKRGTLEGLQKQLTSEQGKLAKAKNTDELVKITGKINSLKAQIANLQAEIAAASGPQFQPTQVSYTPLIVGGIALVGLVAVVLLVAPRKK